MGKYYRTTVHLGVGREGERRKRALDVISDGNVSGMMCDIADGSVLVVGEGDVEMNVGQLVRDVREAIYRISPNADDGWVYTLEDELRTLWE